MKINQLTKMKRHYDPLGRRHTGLILSVHPHQSKNTGRKYNRYAVLWSDGTISDMPDDVLEAR